MTSGSENAPTGRSRAELNPVLATVSAFALLALASYGFAVYDVVRGLLAQGLPFTLVDRDFANYWVGGQLALSGEHLELFSHDLYFPRLQQLFGADYQIRNWGYPPHYLFFVWPLGALGYKGAFVAFFVSTFLLFVAATLVFKREFAPRADSRVLVLALFGYALMMLNTAQNGFLTSTFLLLGLAWMKQRPVLAGIAFACLTVKPQLGLLIPVLLVFDRNWAALLWSTVFTAVLVLLSVAAFGVDSWMAYLMETLQYQRSVMTNWYGIFLRMMPTVFASMRTLGFTPAEAAQAQLPVTVVAAAAILWLLQRQRDRLTRAFVVTCGTFLITPYGFNYDMGALSVCASLLAVETLGRGRKRTAVLIAVIAAISAAVMNLGRAGLPITPLMFAIGLGALIVALRPYSEPGSTEPSGSAPTAA